MTPFCGWGSTASRLELLPGGSFRRATRGRKGGEKGGGGPPFPILKIKKSALIM